MLKITYLKPKSITPNNDCLIKFTRVRLCFLQHHSSRNLDIYKGDTLRSA